MRFTATSKFNSIARGSAKVILWTVEVKKTAVLNESLSTGTWVDVTSRIAEMPSISTRNEFELGQFSADSLTLTGIGIAWWRANIFGYANHLEIKVTCKIGLSEADLATDTVYAFSGLIDKLGVEENEIEDTVAFTAFTLDEYGDRVSGHLISTQYINPDVDGSGTAGLIMPRLTGMYVTNAAVTSYQLKPGVHTLTFRWEPGSPLASLDGGREVTLVQGANTLGDGSEEAEDDQRLTVYVDSLYNLPPFFLGDIVEDLIVITQGDTLPRQWFYGMSLRNLLPKAYDLIGIETLEMDDLEFAGWDGLPRLGYLNVPPEDGSVTGYRWAMVTDGTDLYIAIGHKLYLYDVSASTYTLLATLASGSRISRMRYHARTGHIWIGYGTGGAMDGKLRRYVISTGTLSAEIDISGSDRNSWQVYDKSLGMGNYEYCVLYASLSTFGVHRVDGTTLAVTQLYTNTDLGYSTGYGAYKGNSYVRGDSFGFQVRYLDPSPVYGYHEVTHGNPDPGWDPGNNARVISNVEGVQHNAAVYDATSDKIFFWNQSIGKLRSVHRATGTYADVAVFTNQNALEDIQLLSGVIYWTLGDLTGGVVREGGKLYNYNGLSVNNLSDEPACYSRYNTLCKIGDVIWGIDIWGRLWKYDAVISMYINSADFEGQTVRGAINQLLQAYNLTHTISSAKKALIYRRGNNAGAAQTSGHSVTLSRAETSSLTKIANSMLKFDFVEVDNGVIRHTYDGTVFDRELMDNVNRLSLQNHLIPDELVKDMTWFIYQYYAITRHRYTVQTANISLYQYEPFDECALSFGASKIDDTLTGVIVGQTIEPDGAMTLEVLAPLS